MSLLRLVAGLGAFSLLMLALAGCAAKRDRYDIPAVPLPAAYQNKAGAAVLKPSAAESGAATESGSADPAATAPREPAGQPSTALDQVLPLWWRLLGSPELDELVDRSLANNQDLRVATLRIAQAKARSDQADADRVPVITAPIQARNEAPAGGIGTVPPGGEITSRKTYQASLRGDWRLDIWGERQSMFESADLQVWRATFQRDDVQRTLVASVVASYVDYLSLNDRVRVARETEAALSAMLSSVEQRTEKGDATITELEQQRAAVYAVRATIPALEQQREEARSNLSFLVGGVPGGLTLSDQGLDSLHYPAVLPGVPSALLLRRPDVRVTEARLLAADADIDTARARVLPPLDLTAQIGYGGLYWSRLFQSHNLFWSAIANLSATIFDKGKRDREVVFARAVHEELAETYVRVIYGAVREVEDSLNAVRQTSRRFDAQQEATDSARRAWEYSTESYGAGAIDYLTLLDTERTYHRNLDDLHSVRRDRYRGLVNLFAALGGGVPPGASLPGEGLRPELPAGVDAGQVLAAMPNAQSVEGWDPAEGQADSTDGAWLVELAGVYDRPGIAVAWRDLRKRFPKLMEGRFLLPRVLGGVKNDDEERTTWHRLFVARFENTQSAEGLCAALHANQMRCRVVPSRAIGAVGAAPATPKSEGGRVSAQATSPAPEPVPTPAPAPAPVVEPPSASVSAPTPSPAPEAASAVEPTPAPESAPAVVPATTSAPAPAPVVEPTPAPTPEPSPPSAQAKGPSQPVAVEAVSRPAEKPDAETGKAQVERSEASAEADEKCLGYTTSLGTFASLTNAARAASSWGAKGYGPYVCRVEDPRGRVFYSVRVGGVFQRDRAASLATVAQATKEGYRAALMPAGVDVPPDSRLP